MIKETTDDLLTSILALKHNETYLFYASREDVFEVTRNYNVYNVYKLYPEGALHCCTYSADEYGTTRVVWEIQSWGY